MTETTDQFIQRLMAAWNSHDIPAATACYAPDFYGINVAVAQPLQGPDSVRQSLSTYLNAFPDLCFSQGETVIQDSRVAIQWVACGTHQGTVLNIPPTGRKITFSGSSFFTLCGDKIQRELTIWDVAGMLRGLGLLPDL